MDSSTFDSSLDYSLHLDLESTSDLELKEIARVSYHGAPSMCYSDIDLVADEIIFRLDHIGYEIRNKEYHPFAEIIQYIFSILKKIKSRKVLIIYTKYNHYLNEPIPSPVMSPVKSPNSVKSPHKQYKTRFMKKPAKSKKSVYQP